MGKPLRVEFELREDDYAAWWRLSLSRRWPAGLMRLLGALGATLALWGAYTYELGPPIAAVACIVAFGIGHYGWAWLVTLGARSAARDVFKARRADTQLGLHRLAIDDDGIAEESAHARHSHRWSAVEDLCETKGHFFVVLAGMQAYVIPRRSFSTEADALAFWSGVQALRPGGLRAAEEADAADETGERPALRS